MNMLILFIDYEVDTGIQLGSQGQGMLHQYQIGEASTSTPVPDRRALQVSAATHRLNSRAPMPQRQSGMVNYSFGSGSAPGSSGPERDSARKVTKRQGKRVARSDKEGDMSMSDSSTLQWRPGMRQTKILDSWSEERKEQTRIRNELISKCKADHTRDQNRVSARKSRQKKEDALQDARSNVQKLQEQNMALAQQAQELNTRINIYEMDIENRGQSIAMLASDNAALQARITQLEMQILQGGQSVQGFQTEETPAQELTPVLPPYSSQVQSQLHGSMFRQNPGPASAHTQGHTQDQLQAQVSPSAQEGSSARESSLSREIAQIRAVNLNDEHEAPSELSPMNTAQGSAELGGQDDVGDMSLYDYEGYFNSGGQA
ncbi:hypothetical protein GL218_06951 [Daldinia childiae]|uniref:uncharacterized protein n=1 Tax=Daldinia childiae TaxID=326645 RepID=UPI001447CBD6|nr:uncharacterized protein GL218_06951 [Daldinia childiae]KAF3055615.1 hypothetical protein GL218_06951 [Daldinia childiae]